MTDRELLELAAKAAGKDIDLTRHDDDLGFAIRHMAKWWNPLKDDGDALRLAVKLQMKLECMVLQSAARTFNNEYAGCVDHADSEQYPNRDFNPDPYAATRRAIVRAAAEIGKEMK